VAAGRPGNDGAALGARFTPAQIAELPDCHPGTVRRWIGRFNREGMAGLADRPRRGRPRLGGQQLAGRIAALLGRPGPWTLPRIRRYPSKDGADAEHGFVSVTSREDLYKAEQSAAGPAGTVVAFSPATLHRGTALTAARGARYTMHFCYRPAVVEWSQRYAWADRSHSPGWYQFIDKASPRQLQLFGFPPPGHRFWTPETTDAMRLRYPGIDWSSWDANSAASP
jgi:hypothetical protein